MTDDLPVRPGVAIPRAELSWRFARAGGPGGQSVNTADSKVDLRWDISASDALPEALKQRALRRLAGQLVDGALVVTASEHRSQLQNRRAAEARLVALVAGATAAPPPRRRPTKPSRRSVQRRLDAKRRRGDVKQQRRAPEQ